MSSKGAKTTIFYHVTVILKYCWDKTIARSGDMYKDDSGIFSLVINWILLILRSPKGGCCSISDDLSCSFKCFGITNTSVQIFAIRISSLKTLPKCLLCLLKAIWTHYYLLTGRVVVNVIVWEIGRGKQAAGQSRTPGRVMGTECLSRDTAQPMEAALINSNEICKHGQLRLQVPGKVSNELGLTVTI